VRTTSANIRRTDGVTFLVRVTTVEKKSRWERCWTACPRCPSVRPKWGSPPFRSSLFVLRASFCHDAMTTSIFPALIYPYKAMPLAWEFYTVGSIKHIICYTWGPDLLIRKNWRVRFLSSLQNRHSKFWPHLYDSWGALKKISQWNHIHPFLISRISPRFAKFYAERRKIRICFSKIHSWLCISCCTKGWGGTPTSGKILHSS